MSKQEMLIEYTIQDIIEFIVNDKGVDYDEAMKLFYTSETFDKLNDIETGLYLESAAYVYSIFTDELKDGSIIQKEY